VGRRLDAAGTTNEADQEAFCIMAAATRMVSQVGAAALGITLLTTLYGGNLEASSFADAYTAGLVLAAVGLVACAFVRPTSGRPARSIDPAEAPAP
jgi:hypothetical protein